MPLPELSSGELPVGVHGASLRETLERFAVGHPQRLAVGRRLERLHQLALATGQVMRFVVFGSFVTDKPAPNDVDVFLVMDDTFEAGKLEGETALVFDHGGVPRETTSVPACFGSDAKLL